MAAEEDLTQHRTALARATGRRKLDVVLDAPDPAALVQSLPAEDLYFAIAEIGPADSGILVQLATPEQFRVFVDLDAWRGGEVDTTRVLNWLDLARSDDTDAYQEKLWKLDIEMLEILLRSLVSVIDLEEEEEPPDHQGPSEQSPDGRFLVLYLGGEEAFAATRRLIRDLYDRDAYEALRLLAAVKWELPSELTESARRWRDARLADLGFPSREEASSLFARVRLDQPPSTGLAEPPDEPPGFFLATFESGSSLDRAAAALDDAARERVQAELVAVLNMALVAEGIEPSDLEAVTDQAAAVRDTIALGLEHLGEAALGTTALKRIFQVGFTRTLELRWRVERILGQLPLQLPGAAAALADPPDDGVVAALLRRRPRYHGALDGDGAPGTDRPFASTLELERTSAALDRVERLGGVLAEAGLDTPAAAKVVLDALGEAGLALIRASDLVATALAREAVGLDFGFAALPRTKLAQALEALARPEIRSAAVARLRDLGARRSPDHARAAEALAHEALGRIERETAALSLGPANLPILVVG